MQLLKRTTFVTALALAGALAAVQVQAQSSGSTPREVQRGVPGTDVDVNTNASGPARSNGMPGVDVDVRNNANRSAAGNADTRAAGAGAASGAAGPDTAQRPARADRN